MRKRKMTERKYLKSPCRVGSIEIKNRIVMEAMGNGISEPDGSASAADVAFYEERAKGGVGLIMSEAISVDSVTGRANPFNMCIDSDSHIEPLKKLTDAVHAYGTAFFMELYHPGRQGSSELNGGRKMFAPSEIPCGLTQQPVCAMTVEDIDYMVEKFVEGAIRSQKGGADGVLLHGAHGYLLNEFLSPYTNKRTDEYGGSPENMARFTVRAIKEIKKACGEDYPVAVRYSACEYLDYNGLDAKEGITLDLAVEYARLFEAAGADLLDISSGIYETMNTAWEPVGFEEGWKANLATEIKKHVGVPVVCTAVIRNPDFAEKLLEEGACDFVGSARSHLADPEWANKAMEGRDCQIRKCISCLNCMKTLMFGPVKCAVNARACHETERGELEMNGNGRKVVIIGAGPAGMEAARVLATRGFDVTIFEKNDYTGGMFRLATLPPHKEKLAPLLDYLEGQLNKLGVELRLGEAPSVDEIKAMNPYAVMVACGTDPIVPKSIPGVDGDKVHTIFEVLGGKVNLDGKNVVIVGGGMVGLEVAEYLNERNATIQVFEMKDGLAMEEHFQNVIDIEHRIGHIPQLTGHRLLEIRDGECVFEVVADGSELVVPCDDVVLSLGMKPSHCASEDYADLNAIVIGANKKFGSVAIAIEDAYLEAAALK